MICWLDKTEPFGGLFLCSSFCLNPACLQSCPVAALCTVLLCGWQWQLMGCRLGQESRSVEHWGCRVRLASVPLILGCFRCGTTGKVSKLAAYCAGWRLRWTPGLLAKNVTVSESAAGNNISVFCLLGMQQTPRGLWIWTSCQGIYSAELWGNGW